MLFESDTAPDDVKRYSKRGLWGLVHVSYVGSEVLLDVSQFKLLETRPCWRAYLTAPRFVKPPWAVRHAPNGVSGIR